VWAGAIYAGNNERYWTALAGRAWWWDTITKVTTTVLCLFAFSFPFIFKPSAKKKKRMIALHLLNIVAFAVSLALLLISSATYNELSLVQKRWQTMRSEWDALLQDRDSLKPVDLAARIEILNEQKQEIEQSEPSEKDKPLMHQAWLEEVYARGVDPEWIAKTAKVRQAVLESKN
jgi:hypothetical protein